MSQELQKTYLLDDRETSYFMQRKFMAFMGAFSRIVFYYTQQIQDFKKREVVVQVIPFEINGI